MDSQIQPEKLKIRLIDLESKYKLQVSRNKRFSFQRYLGGGGVIIGLFLYLFVQSVWPIGILLLISGIFVLVRSIRNYQSGTRRSEVLRSQIDSLIVQINQDRN